MNGEDSTSPVEDQPWPAKLPAFVTTDGERPRVRGFDLVDDLARHYDFAEFLVTALTGVPPTASWGTAVNMALVALSGASVRRASVHAATVARRCGADDSSVLATGLLGLIEEAASEVACASVGSRDACSFRDALPQEVRASVPEGPTVESVAFAVLEAAGLKTPLHRMAALCVARLPSLVAEASSVRAGDLQGYPMRLPNFEYQESPPDDV